MRDIPTLHAAYSDGSLTPRLLVEQVLQHIDAQRQADGTLSPTWISVLSAEALEEYVVRLEGRDMAELPLYGVPFAVKDNIDLVGLPTTAACPEYAYRPEKSAYVVQRLVEAGAIPVGKTNMDQFATGLVGTRSPYGVPVNPYGAEYLPGGSSSGSAVAVADGTVCFSLGTDTAGSGRVPAAFNNLVGHKPTKGMLSTAGVVPACRSLDCVSIFAHTAADAAVVYDVAAAFDATDVYARLQAPTGATRYGESFTFGVPRAEQLEFFGDAERQALFAQAVMQLENAGGQRQEIDFAPFLEAARLLYEGPWVAERYVAIEEVLHSRPEILHPVTRNIIQGGSAPTAADTFRAIYRLRALQRQADAVLSQVDCILTPTTGTHYTVAQVEHDPVTLNSHLGYYTNFMNLLDYAATAYPAGFTEAGLPFGVTVFGPAGDDAALLELAQRMSCAPAGQSAPEPCVDIPAGMVPVVVCGAHLEGQPLNWQLTDRGGYLWQCTHTAPLYEFYALPPVGDTIPPRPGVKRVPTGGTAIYVEVWLLPMEQFGSFVAGIPEPLGIGKVTLADGETQYPGFICEGHALEDAQNITHLADWRIFVKGN